MIEERYKERKTTLQDEAPHKALTTADLAQRSAVEKTTAGTLPSTPEITGRISLFPENDLNDARTKWQDVQGSFVDDPRVAVRRADELVASLMSRLAEIFSNERTKLEKEWDQGENISTESLRLALQRYRSFFDRLLSV